MGEFQKLGRECAESLTGPWQGPSLASVVFILETDRRKNILEKDNSEAESRAVVMPKSREHHQYGGRGVWSEVVPTAAASQERDRDRQRTSL